MLRTKTDRIDAASIARFSLLHRPDPRAPERRGSARSKHLYAGSKALSRYEPKSGTGYQARVKCNLGRDPLAGNAARHCLPMVRRARLFASAVRVSGKPGHAHFVLRRVNTLMERL